MSQRDSDDRLFIYAHQLVGSRGEPTLRTTCRVVTTVGIPDDSSAASVIGVHAVVILFPDQEI